jgi:osmotically-inducible protein OsmY
MRADIERDVKDELQWRPDLDATDIAVSVKNGVVTLTGFVHSYVDKFEAEAAAKHVAGVVGVANDIEVRLRNVDAKPDPEIAREAVAAIKSQLPYSWENIKVIVKDGWVHLEGEEEWQFQRDIAEQAVCRLQGVKGVSNLIKLKPQAQPSEIKRKIQEAFTRNAELDANSVVVEANGSEVILKGTVRSWAELKEAERVAWSAPGVIKVENKIVVRPQMAAA